MPRRTRSPSRLPASSIGGPIDRPQPPSSVNQVPTGRSGAPVSRRQHRRATRHPRGRAEELDVDALPGQIAIGDQADSASGLEPFGEHADRRPLATGQRDDLHAQALAVGDESVEQRLGFESLGDGRERLACTDRSARCRRRPSCPCAARRARSRGRPRPPRRCDARRSCVDRRPRRSPRDPSSAAETSRASTARSGASRPRPDSSSSASAAIGADDAAQVGPQLAHPASAAANGKIGAEPEAAPARAARAAP